ncbi:MAG TPA: NHL repeat-containing protein [Solirubrobacteraceae bacterium]|nr:NHL repeat-containing protein [Solirubrobacteraceae bacterium]
MAVLLLAVCALFGASAASQAALVHPFSSQITGEKATKPFAFLCGLNISPGTGELFAADAGKIDVFDSTNAFLRKLGKRGESEAACSTAVNDTTQTLYVANPGEGEPERPSQKEAVFVYALVAGKYEPQKTLDGSNTPAKTFEGELFAGVVEAGSPLHVAVAQKSAQANSEDIYVAVGGFQGVVDQFSSAGEYLKQIVVSSGEPQGMAVGPSGELYVVILEGERYAVNEYNPAGELIAHNDGSGAGGFGAVSGVAVDAAGNLYVSDSARERVDQFDSSGGFQGAITGGDTPQTRLNEPGAVAVNRQSGAVYVADRTVEGASVIDIFGSATVGAGPFLEGEGVTGVTATSATLQASIDPSGVATTFHFEYGPQGGPYSSTPETKVGSGTTIQQASLEVSGLLANTTYEFRAVVTASGHAAEVGELRSFTTHTEGTGVKLPDSRGWELVSPVNKHGALIEGIGATQKAGGVVQASADGSRITYTASAPLEENVEANQGHAPALSVRGSGGWATREIKPPGTQPTSTNAFSRRGLENRIFSADLTSSIVDPFGLEPALSPQASERAPYRRDLNDVACRITEAKCYTPLVTAKDGFADVSGNDPFGGQSTGPLAGVGAVVGVGAAPDLNHVIVQSEVSLLGPESHGVYEWSTARPASERLQLVSLLPGNLPVPPQFKSSFGDVRRSVQNARHAISDDGSLVVWSTEPSGSLPGHLYLRDTALGQTLQLAKLKEGEEIGTGEGARFQTASADGRTIFFSDENKLTAGSTAVLGKPDLYACHVQVAEGHLACEPEDLTATEKNAGESAALQHLVIEASKSGTDVYFVANGVLSSNSNAHGEEATPGNCGENPPSGATCNLYVEHYSGSAWEEPVFIAALSADDGPDWGVGSSGKSRVHATFVLEDLTARVSPNGQYLAFMSDRRLTGYDNTDASPSAGGSHDEEVFLYNAAAKQLVCASCNPSGARPHGLFDNTTPAGDEHIVDVPGIWAGRWLAGNIPGWTSLEVNSSLYQARYLSEHGRLFFNSSDALSQQDKNGGEDVYEYEPTGVGSCASSPGCAALISSGESTDESAFLDASENGGDAFFLTKSNLVTQDLDQAYDVYDAHDCGESPCIAPATQPAPCNSSTTCQGNSTSSTNFATPSSSTNAGNALTIPGPAPKGQPLGTKNVKPTRAQLLAKALKKCKKLKRKKPRVSCEKQARKLYAPKHPRKKHKSAKR